LLFHLGILYMNLNTANDSHHKSLNYTVTIFIYTLPIKQIKPIN